MSYAPAEGDGVGDGAEEAEEEPAAGRSDRAVPWLRVLALAGWLALSASYLGVLYHVTDVAGGVRWLAAVVAGAALLGAALARLVAPRVAVALGVAGLAAGLVVYLVAVPEVLGSLASVDFFTDLWRTFAGKSVLGFLAADRWAVSVAPAPTFLSTYLVVRRRYDWSAAVGGLALGFFVLSGDAGDAATLVGVVGALATVGVGSLDRADAPLERVESVGLGLVVVVLAARFLTLVPEGRAASAGGDGGGDTTPDDRTIEDVAESLVDGPNAGDDLGVRGRISLSPAVRFTVTADRPAFWHVASYDRYAGDGWVATGERSPYDGRLAGPPGRARTVGQRVRAETDLDVLPAAWKPVAVDAAGDVAVTAGGDLRPADGLDAGDSYEVESRVVDWSSNTLRRAGTDYPSGVAERYRQLPGSTPDRVLDLAERIAGDADTPYDAATAVEAWLESEKGYSLDVQDPGTDAADAFLFGMDRGYCVHFATGMAVCCRALDVPARVAVGYLPGQSVGEGRWVVRGLDSHAWVELYFPGVGWVPFDPTPSVPRRAAESGRLAAARDANVSGVDVGDSRPNGTGDDGAAGLDGLTDDGGTTAAVPGADGTATTTAGRDGLADGPVPEPGSDANASSPPGNRLPGADALAGRDRLTLLATAAGVVLGVRRLGLVERGRREVWLREQEATDDPAADVATAFGRLEVVLGRRHRPRRDAETPRRYAAALGVDADPRVARVLAHHERARYAGEVTREAADDAIETVDELVAERDWVYGRATTDEGRATDDDGATTDGGASDDRATDGRATDDRATDDDRATTDGGS